MTEFDRQFDNNAAYDLSLFETKPKKQEEEKKNNVIEMPAKRVNQNARRLENFIKAGSIILIAAIVFTLFYSLLYCRVQITELHNEINTVEQELSIAKSDYSVLQMELDSKTSLESIEKKSEQLGMRQLEDYQIEYFSLSDGDKAEIVEPTGSENIFSKISEFFSNLGD